MPPDDPEVQRAKARARIRDLEADPRHTGENPHAAAQTRTDRLDDPTKQNPHAQRDPRWREVEPGVWSHPDHDDS